MAAIGEPYDYLVVIKEATATAPALADVTLTSVQFESLSWGRRNSDVSTAQISTWVDCVDLPALRGWDQEVVIYRNGLIVWWGPIVGWTVSASGRCEIVAHDVFAWTKKRVLPADFSVSQVDAWQVISDRMTEVAAVDFDPHPWESTLDPNGANAWLTENPSGDPVVFGKYVTMDYRVEELSTVFGFLARLVDEFDVTYTAIGARVLWDQPTLDLRVPVGPSHVSSDPVVVTDCLGTADRAYIGRDGAGAYGFADVTLLGPFNTIPAYAQRRQEAVIAEQPNLLRSPSLKREPWASMVANRYGPTVTLEDLVLAPTFGGGAFGFDGINMLAPGLTLSLRFDDFTPGPTYSVEIPRPTRVDIFPPPDLTPVLVESANLAIVDEVSVEVAVSEEGITETITVAVRPWAAAE